MAHLELHGVSIALGRRDVVREVSAQVDPGELVVVVGPSGAGKTTLLRAIGRLAPPRTGTIRVLGRDPLRAPRRDIARELAYLPPATLVLAGITMALFATSSLLVGAAIAEVGPIGFIGLIVPHALRALLGPDHRLRVPASMFGGAAVLTVCDTLARTAVPLHHLPAGAVTSVLGVPFFTAILVGQKQRAALWGRG
jgi:hypothetical protein